MKKRASTNLIGKAGVGLACYHLARIGHDFTLTANNSGEGDLWVNFDGNLEKVEVKSTRLELWHLRINQLSRVSRVIFVAIDDGCCWMISASAPLDFLRSRGGKDGVLTVKQLEGMEPEALHKRVPRVCPYRPQTRKDAIPGAPGNRIVVKRLKNGTMKRYEYPPWNS